MLGPFDYVVAIEVTRHWSLVTRHFVEAALAQPDLVRGPVGLDTLPGPFRIVTNPATVAAAGAGALACLFLLLFVFRRRLYILHWTMSWVLMAGSMLLTARAYGEGRSARVMLGLSQFLAISAALLLVQSADRFKGRTSIPPRFLIGLLPLLIWFALAPLVLGQRAVIVPGYLMSAGALAVAAFAYLTVARKGRLLGAGLVGGTLAALAVSHAWTAFVTSRSDTMSEIPLAPLVIDAVMYLLAALGMHLLVFEDMTHELRLTNRELSTAQDDLRMLAITDTLTGCYNRRFFQQIIDRELRRHQRYDLPLSILFVDIDQFKIVNDLLGHDAGDRVLREVAELLKSRVRDADYVFRWGGDEFVVLLSCNEDHARHKAAQIKAAFDGLPSTEGLPPGVGLSVGSVEAPDEAIDPMKLIEQADALMYRDKKAGKVLVN